ncbi:MAG: hypothetical protein ABRQ39_32710 [Candidatus Eremiobacterota bacterium]
MEEKKVMEEIKKEFLPLPTPAEQKLIDLTTMTPKQKLITLLKLGNSLKTSIEFAGIDSKIYGIWLKNDKKFEEDVKQARAEADIFDCEIIRKASQNEWQAAAFRIKQREAAQKRGHYSVKMATPADCRKLLQKVTAQLLNDEIEIERARAIGYLINCAIKVIEASDLAERLEKLEEALQKDG